MNNEHVMTDNLACQCGARCWAFDRSEPCQGVMHRQEQDGVDYHFCDAHGQPDDDDQYHPLAIGEWPYY